MENRLRGEEEFQSIAEDLVAAIAEMKPAEEKLNAKAPNDALPPEQRALVHLQRAEARFRDVQVAFQQGGMPGEQQRMAEDLADLFELELDKLHNQYETVERGERQETQQEVDEALQRLEELARRQEQENERQRKLPAQMGMSGAAGQNQRQLIEQTEELARQLERLARERSRPDLAQTARRLQQAADSMKRASANRSSGEIGQGTEALEQLREARRLLERNREFEMSSEMDDLTERAERARRMQERITSQVGELPAQSEESRGGGRGESSEQVGADPRREGGARARGGRAREPDRSRRAAGARNREGRRAQPVGGRRVDPREPAQGEDPLLQGRRARPLAGVRARRFEEEIGGDIEEMQERLGEAKQSMGGTKEDKTRRCPAGRSRPGAAAGVVPERPRGSWLAAAGREVGALGRAGIEGRPGTRAGTGPGGRGWGAGRRGRAAGEPGRAAGRQAG